MPCQDFLGKICLEEYFQEFGPRIFMGETYFQEFAPIFSWVKNIFRNLVPIFGSPELVGTLPQAVFFFRKMASHILVGFLLELFAIVESETLLDHQGK